MEIYILRHGDAELHDNAIADKDRKLTGKGKRDVHAVLEAARRAKAAPELILTSPLRRAQETAAIAATLFKSAKVMETRHLLPGASPAELWREIGSLRDVQQVLLAGHQPQLGHMVAFLLEAAAVADLKKSALVRITTANRLGPPRGVLKWMITPRLVRRQE